MEWICDARVGACVGGSPPSMMLLWRIDAETWRSSADSQRRRRIMGHDLPSSPTRALATFWTV